MCIRCGNAQWVINEADGKLWPCQDCNAALYAQRVQERREALLFVVAWDGRGSYEKDDDDIETHFAQYSIWPPDSERMGEDGRQPARECGSGDSETVEGAEIYSPVFERELLLTEL